MLADHLRQPPHRNRLRHIAGRRKEFVISVPRALGCPPSAPLLENTIDTSQMSKKPSPSGRVDMNSSFVPSAENSGFASTSGVLIPAPRWTTAVHGEDGVARVVTHRSSPPRPPALSDWMMSVRPSGEMPGHHSWAGLLTAAPTLIGACQGSARDVRV